MPLRTRHWITLSAALLLAPTALTRAQQPVDNSVGRVDNRVGGELYRRGDTGARYPAGGQTRLLPSEERNAVWRSGMLPSEYRANRTAFGPLPPEGTINYVTRRSPLQRAMNLPEPRLANPAYDPMAPQPGQRLDAWPDPTPGGYPQTLRDGLAASNRVPGATSLNRPPVPRLDTGSQLQQQSQPAGSPLPPLQPGPIEVEPPQPALAVPRPLQPPPSTRPAAPSEAPLPTGPVVPSLTGAPGYRLPTGEPPRGTPASSLLSRSPSQQ
jgi:hypothetical protein